jgi:phytoene synthase
MIEKAHLERSKAIQRRTGRTFHFATRLLPERIRHATYVLYAFFRVADDVVDDPNPPPAERQRAALERIREGGLGECDTDDPVLLAFQEVRARYDIPAREVREFIAAMERDITAERYDTHDDLAAYLRGSSVAVAYMMLAVMDPEDREQARPHARALAEAFQLTNFLRDVREDVVEYDRIYLPRATLARHGVPDEQIERLEFSEEFATAMRAELERTERRYHEGVAGIEHLPEDCQFGVLLAAVLYADHHRLIRAQGYDVLSAQPSLSGHRRLGLFVRTWWHWRRTGDPRATFDAVSAVPSEGDDPPDHGATSGGERRASLTAGSGRSVVRSLRSVLSMGGSE